MRAHRSLITAALALAIATLSAPIAGATVNPRPDLSDPGFDAASVRLASGRSGDIVALWREKRGDDWRLYAAATDEGSDAFGPSAAVSSVGADAWDPQAAVAADGASLLIWNSSDGGHQMIKVASRAPGQGWSTPQTISAPGADAYHAQVAMGKSGSAVAVWSRSDGTRNVIQAAVLPTGGSWGKAVDLSDAANATRGPQVAVGGDGTAVAIWERRGGDYSSIQASVLAPGGTWTVAQRLSIPGADATSARVAMDDAGDALATWRWYDGIDWIMASSFRPAGHDWQRVRQVSEPGFSATSPSLAMNGSGRAVAVWTEATGVWSAQFTSDARWTRTRALNDSQIGPRAASVAMDAAGNEAALWFVNGSIYESFRGSNDDAWGESQELDCLTPDADTCYFTYQPHAVITAPDKVLAVWIESRDEYQVVAAITYDAATVSATPGDNSNDGTSGASTADTIHADTGIVVERTSPLLTGRRIRVTVRCMATHECRGHLLLRRRTGPGALAGRPVRVLPGQATVLLLRLAGLPRSVLVRGARLRTHISIERARRGRQPVASSHSLVIVGRLPRLPVVKPDVP